MPDGTAPDFENVTVQCKNTCFVSTTCFLGLRRACLSTCFNRHFRPDSSAPCFLKLDRAMRDHMFRIYHLMLWVRKVCQSICFKRKFNPDGPAPYFSKRHRAMREHIFCIHHLLFMIQETVSEYMLQKVVQSRRFRSYFSNTWPWNARTGLSYPPLTFYNWGECVRVYVASSTCLLLFSKWSSLTIAFQRDSNNKRCGWTKCCSLWLYAFEICLVKSSKIVFEQRPFATKF